MAGRYLLLLLLRPRQFVKSVLFPWGSHRGRRRHVEVPPFTPYRCGANAHNAEELNVEEREGRPRKRTCYERRTPVTEFEARSNGR